MFGFGKPSTTTWSEAADAVLRESRQYEAERLALRERPVITDDWVRLEAWIDSRIADALADRSQYE